MFLLWPGALVVPQTRLFCLTVFLLLTNHLQWSGKVCRFWVLNVRHAGQSRLKNRMTIWNAVIPTTNYYASLKSLHFYYLCWISGACEKTIFLPARDSKTLTVQQCILVMLVVFQEKKQPFLYTPYASLDIQVWMACKNDLLEQRKDFPLQFLSELAGISQVVWLLPW